MWYKFLIMSIQGAIELLFWVRFHGDLGTFRRDEPCFWGVGTLRDQDRDMKRLIIPVTIVIIILAGLAFLTEGSALTPFLYRNF